MQKKKNGNEYAPDCKRCKLATKEKGWWDCYNEYASDCKRKGMVMNMLQIASVVSWQPKRGEIAVTTKENGWWGCYNEYAPDCKRKGMVMNMLQIASVVSWQPKKRDGEVAIMNILQIAKEN